MLDNAQTKYNEQIKNIEKSEKEVIYDIMTDTKEEKTEKKTSEWKEKKEQFSNKIVTFAKELCEGESDAKISSVLSGSYFEFRKELKGKK